MSIHFQNEAEAIAHLNSKGFRKIKSGNWVNTSGIAAHILTCTSECVLVQMWEVL